MRSPPIRSSKVKLAEMDELLAKNPERPGRPDRARRLRLDKGDLPGAIDDLRKALKNNPPAETRSQGPRKLYETLTEYCPARLQRRREVPHRVRGAVQGAIEPDASDADEPQRQKPRSARRRANFLCLVAKGREAQGKLVEAFEKYQEFAALAGKDELIPLLDEPTVRAAPDVWSQGRIAAMVAKATPEQPQAAGGPHRRRWKKLQQSTTDLDDLRSFVRCSARCPRSARRPACTWPTADRGPRADGAAGGREELNLLRTPREAPADGRPGRRGAWPASTPAAACSRTPPTTTACWAAITPRSRCATARPAATS